MSVCKTEAFPFGEGGEFIQNDWITRRDSNSHRPVQSRTCYHYTTREDWFPEPDSNLHYPASKARVLPLDDPGTPGLSINRFHFKALSWLQIG